MVKSFLLFVDYFATAKVFGKFLHVKTMKLVKAGNWESFSGMKVKA